MNNQASEAHHHTMIIIGPLTDLFGILGLHSAFSQLHLARLREARVKIYNQSKIGQNRNGSVFSPFDPFSVMQSWSQSILYLTTPENL